MAMAISYINDAIITCFHTTWRKSGIVRAKKEPITIHSSMGGIQAMRKLLVIINRVHVIPTSCPLHELDSS